MSLGLPSLVAGPSISDLLDVGWHPTPRNAAELALRWAHTGHSDTLFEPAAAMGLLRQRRSSWDHLLFALNVIQQWLSSLAMHCSQR
jgi:hypothetical protein